jgi:hypothetical protein
MLQSGDGDIGTIDAQQSLFGSAGQAGGHCDVQAVGYRWVPESAAADPADPAAVESLWIVPVANRIGSNLHIDAPAPVVRLLAEKAVRPRAMAGVCMAQDAKIGAPAINRYLSAGSDRLKGDEPPTPPKPLLRSGARLQSLELARIG